NGAAELSVIDENLFRITHTPDDELLGEWVKFHLGENGITEVVYANRTHRSEAAYKKILDRIAIKDK
ncbi:MAG: hypothetical protein Q8O19_05595, partial [Rectinemataceae bacterium]|nr:hypothetical protein [Rectinemataceae bacterium]